jgi:hypothetical protein
VNDKPSSAEDLDKTAIHEAGHAVMHLVLSLGIKSLTIVPDYERMIAGASTHGGEWGNPAQDFGEQDDDTATLRLVAEDTFWLRHAVACYAGAEAVRQLRPASDPDEGADSDNDAAVDAINSITDDAESLDLYFALAKRRCVLLVAQYAPEIEAVAAALRARQTLCGEDVREIFATSIRSRKASLLSW